MKYPSIYDVVLGTKQMIRRISQCIQELANSFLNLDCQNKEMEKLPELLGNEQVELVEMLSVKSMVGETTAGYPEFDRLFFCEMRQTSIIKLNGKQKDIDLKDATPRSNSQNSDVQVASISTSTPTRCLMESRQECNDDTPRPNSESSDIQVAPSTSASTFARYLLESRRECNDDHPLAHSIDARRRALSYAEKHNTDVAKSLPKLGKPDYYTSPGMEEIMQRERATPGFCSKVPDIVVGCKGHGRIKFLGETDVRGLKLDDIVVFKTNGDVSVYANDSDVPIGKGLNKPAEVTLENIRPGMDKDTGKQQEVDEFIEELKCKSTEQGTQYMSYDSEKGEWTFRVQHF